MTDDTPGPALGSASPGADPLGEGPGEPDDAFGSRGVELVVALLLMALAAVVMGDSLRIGAGWADDGPQAGYFPFYIGLAMFVSSGWIALAHLRGSVRAATFARRSELRSVAQMFVPTCVYVVLIKLLGIYVASVLLIGWFMLRHGRHHPATTAGVALGVPIVFFVVFERWFVVPLPKGPLEALMGM